MKIQCNACEAAEAAVMCCADEAALCWACDQKVHAANKLAGKHQRVPLLPPNQGSAPSSRVPKCDVCKEGSGYFFCLEDRALLCRKCDVAIHTANSFVSAHQRFLLTGVQVGLEATTPVASFPKEQADSARRVSKSTNQLLQNGNPSLTFDNEARKMFSGQLGIDGDLAVSKETFSSSTMVGNISDWPLDELFAFPDLNQGHGFTEPASKADSDQFWGREGSPLCYTINEGLNPDKYLAEVPEIQWNVPDIPFGPSTSRLNWISNSDDPSKENGMFVPDISSPQTPGRFRAKAALPKRSRTF